MNYESAQICIQKNVFTASQYAILTTWFQIFSSKPTLHNKCVRENQIFNFIYLVFLKQKTKFLIIAHNGLSSTISNTSLHLFTALLPRESLFHFLLTERILFREKISTVARTENSLYKILA